jgi:DNA-binding MarR family transcriptional regulator
MRVYTRIMTNTSCHCIILRKAARKLSAYYDEALAPFGLNIGQFSLLRQIRRYAPLSLTELAAQADLDRSTVGRNVKVLARMGLVLISDGGDLRQAVLDLTDAGQSVLREANPAWERVQADIEHRMGPSKTEQLRELLALL